MKRTANASEPEDRPHAYRQGCSCSSCRLHRLYGVGEPFDRGDILYEQLLCGQPPGYADRPYIPLVFEGRWQASALTIIIKYPPSPPEYRFHFPEQGEHYGE